MKYNRSRRSLDNKKLEGLTWRRVKTQPLKSLGYSFGSVCMLGAVLLFLSGNITLALVCGYIGGMSLILGHFRRSPNGHSRPKHRHHR